jgi:sugar phosphate isomerase/epimerase
MFKTGVISDEISQDFERVCKVARELGLDSVEIRTAWDKNPQDLEDDDVKKMKKILKENGLRVCAIASPFLKCDLDSEEEYKQHLRMLKKFIKLANEFEIRIIRGFAFWKKEGPLEKYWERIISKFSEPVKILESEGIFLGIENEAATFLGTGEEVAKFLKEINSENVKALWDPANEVFASGGENPFPGGYNWIKESLVHMHIKDARKNEEAAEVECTPVGEGVIDYEGHFKQLRKDGYKGYLSLETHWRPRKELSEDLLNRPGGSTFSEFGEEATRICAKNWFEIMGRIS